MTAEEQPPLGFSEAGKQFHAASCPMATLMRSMFALRSRFAEDALAQVAARGIRQYVIFGSGLDTFPWRQPDFAKDMQIFALDHPASLIQSNRVFREHRFARQPNLIRVPLDLEQSRIDEQLGACDFDSNTASFCSALGLMFYLKDEIVDNILRFVASLPPSSEIVLSFIPPDDDLDGIDLEIVRRAATKHSRALEKPSTAARNNCGSPVLASARSFTRRPNWRRPEISSGRPDKLTAPHFEQMISATV